MDIVYSDNPRARLANKALYVVREIDPIPPHEDMDMLFTPKNGQDGDVFGFELTDSYGEVIEFYAPFSKIEAEKPKDCDDVNKWLEDIKRAEKHITELWLKGEVFSVSVKHWDPAKRKFVTDDSVHQLYGMNDVWEIIADEKLDEGCDVIVDCTEGCMSASDFPAKYNCCSNDC